MIAKTLRIGKLFVVGRLGGVEEWHVSALEPYAPEPGDKVVVTLKDGQKPRLTYCPKALLSACTEGCWEGFTYGANTNNYGSVLIAKWCIASITPDLEA